MSTICSGKKEDGTPCSKPTRDASGFCHLHLYQARGGNNDNDYGSDEASVCHGKKADGTPCSNTTRDASSFCHHHRDQASANEADGDLALRSDTEFDRYSSRRNSDIHFLGAFASWCQFCPPSKSVFLKEAHNNPSASFAFFDEEDCPEACESLGLESFPSFFYMEKGSWYEMELEAIKRFNASPRAPPPFQA
jgi:hypothetical protein